MTVSELRKSIEGVDGDYMVSICVDTPPGYMCPDGAVVGVKRVARGIDWHGHELLIVPDTRLEESGSLENVENR